MPSSNNKIRIKSAGRYTVQTEGETDLVMKLFGPNSMTQLVAEDDDSGTGSNPKITVDLAPGEYYVQVRHYIEPAAAARMVCRW